MNRTGGSASDGEPWLSPEGLELYFNSYRSGGYGKSDIWIARRATAADAWSAPVNVGLPVNDAYDDHSPSLSPDGLLLFFAEWYTATPLRPGGYGGGDIWMARRAGIDAPWQTPVNPGPNVNGPGWDFVPRISPDGRTLFFWSDVSRGSDVWQVSIEAVINFNADGQVDLVDLTALIDNWGTDNTLYDIGPYAWGDGVVDVQDLKVFIAEWEKGDSGTNP